MRAVVHVYVPVHCGAPAVLYVPAGHSGFVFFTTSTRTSHVSNTLYGWSSKSTLALGPRQAFGVLEPWLGLYNPAAHTYVHRPVMQATCDE